MVIRMVKKFQIFLYSNTLSVGILAETSCFSYPSSSFPSLEHAEMALSRGAWDLVDKDYSFVIIPVYFAVEVTKETSLEDNDCFLPEA